MSWNMPASCKYKLLSNTVNDVPFEQPHFEITVILSNDVSAMKFYLIAASLIHLLPTSQSSFEDVRPNLFAVNV